MMWLYYNPHEFGTEQYKEYESLRKTRNGQLLFAFVNFPNIFRDFNTISQLDWLPGWTNYVFMFLFAFQAVYIFGLIFKMKQIAIDKENEILVQKVMEE